MTDGDTSTGAWILRSRSRRSAASTICKLFRKPSHVGILGLSIGPSRSNFIPSSDGSFSQFTFGRTWLAWPLSAGESFPAGPG